MLSKAGPVSDMVQHAEIWACRAPWAMLPQASQKPTGDTGLTGLLLMGSASRGCRCWRPQAAACTTAHHVRNSLRQLSFTILGPTMRMGHRLQA